MIRKIITTKDGSKTIHLPDWNESYHSQHGAYQEAMHVFIQSGLNQISEQIKIIDILEVGFGTGLNALISLREAKLTKRKVNYEGLEAFPVTKEEWDAMEYTELESLKNYKEEYEQLFLAPWNSPQNINSTFSMLKTKATLQEFSPENEAYNLIYFDAFGPRVQPEMWTPPIFKKLYHALQKNGIFVTYCCKGQVRRDLIAAGFEVEKIPGPPGKREMLRARK
jgi:tRNA U34 5-methylaminomethyl-2-thiouridine-forming methyltransferase MnmC